MSIKDYSQGAVGFTIPPIGRINLVYNILCLRYRFHLPLSVHFLASSRFKPTWYGLVKELVGRSNIAYTTETSHEEFHTKIPHYGLAAGWSPRASAKRSNILFRCRLITLKAPFELSHRRQSKIWRVNNRQRNGRLPRFTVACTIRRLTPIICKKLDFVTGFAVPWFLMFHK